MIPWSTSSVRTREAEVVCGAVLLGVFYLVVTAVAGLVGTVCGMSYSSDLTDDQWALLEPVFNAPG